MAAKRPGSRNRRRQRSVRVTVAVGLLSLATLAVLGSLPTQSPLWLSLASTSAIVLSWAALRITWTEVLQSRRENSADRAAAATAYRELFSVRAAEHAEFTEAMTERLAEAHLAQRELEGLVAYQEGRARRAETKLVAESKALVETRNLKRMRRPRQRSSANLVCTQFPGPRDPWRPGPSVECMKAAGSNVASKAIVPSRENTNSGAQVEDGPSLRFGSAGSK